MRNPASNATIVLALTVAASGFVAGRSATGQEAKGPAVVSPKPVRALLRVSTASPRATGRPADPIPDLDVYRATLAALMTGHDVLGPALKDARVAKLSALAGKADPETWLAGALVVEAPPKTELLSVSLSLPDRAEAVALVDAVVESFLEHVVREDLKDRISRRERLRQLLAEKQAELDERRRMVHEIENSGGPDDHSIQAVRRELARADLEDGRKELRQVRLQRVGVEAQFGRVKSGDSARLAALKDSLETLRVQEAHLKEEQEAILTTLSRTDRKGISLEFERSDLATTEATTRTIEAALLEINIELNKPHSVRKLSETR